jgi:hypothetical protein
MWTPPEAFRKLSGLGPPRPCALLYDLDDFPVYDWTIHFSVKITMFFLFCNCFATDQFPWNQQIGNDYSICRSEVVPVANWMIIPSRLAKDGPTVPGTFEN